MTALTIVQKQAVNIRNCRVASISEANDHVLFEILLGKYIYVCTLCKQVLQLRKLDGCTLRRMAYSSAAV